MVALDLDGTLLNSRKEVTPYTAKVLEEAMAAGTAVVISTGRPLTALPKEVLKLKGIRYALTANGARIYDLEKNEMIYEKLVDYEVASKILDVFYRFDALYEIYYDGQGYADEEKLKQVDKYLKDPYMADYVSSTRKSVPNLRELFDSEKRSVDKVQAIFDVHEDRIEAEKILREDPELCRQEIAGALADNIEVNAEGVNKGKGLLRLGEILGISREEIMACGDGGNDLEMMREVGLAVAMKNSCDSILEEADYITDTNDNDGVAKAVEKFVLGR